MSETCSGITTLLATRPLGVLDASEAAFLEGHLSQCDACQRASRELEDFLSLAAPKSREAPGDSVWERVAQRVAEHRSASRAPAPEPPVFIRCTFCHAALDRLESAFCASCLAPHHTDCFESHGKCSAPGCGDTRTVRPLMTKKAPRRRVRRAPIVVLALVAGSAVAALVARGRHESPPSSSHVVVTKPSRQELVRTIALAATVTPFREATVFAQVSGSLATVTVDRGDFVHHGDVVATVDSFELEAERKQAAASRAQASAELRAVELDVERLAACVDGARADERRAEARESVLRSQYERVKGLRADNVVSVQELEVAEGAWKQAAADLARARAAATELSKTKEGARAQIDIAQAQLDRASSQLEQAEKRLALATIRAPLDGIVTARSLGPGAVVREATPTEPGTAIVRVSEVRRVKVVFEIAQREIASVTSGQLVRFSVDSLAGRTFAGRVARAGDSLDATTRSMRVEVELDNSDQALLPGMVGEASIELERRPNALSVPAEAMRVDSGHAFVLVVEGGVLRRRGVTVGLTAGARVEIVQGLAGGESVVVGGTAHEGESVSSEERR